MIHSILVISKHGKLRLKKWYSTWSSQNKQKYVAETLVTILNRKPNMCNVVEWKDYKLIYRRYASLYFCLCVDPDENELLCLEIIHRYVQSLDHYFGNVCELDIVFNFQAAYMILDELILAGEQVESSAKETVRIIQNIDDLEKSSPGLDLPPPLSF